MLDNRTPLAYYMPVYLRELAKARGDETLLDFCQLFSVVNNNACVIDRTGTLSTPFATHSLYPVPDQTDNVKDFGTLCIERAEEILAENKPVYFMYSGGLDSTCMLVAFHEVLRRKGDYSQLIVATSAEAVAENPMAWNQVVRPHYKIIQARDMLAEVALNDCRYVQGENADQLFGSDRVFTDTHLLHQEFTRDNLNAFLADRINRESALERLQEEFWQLAQKCPLPLKHTREFLWWMNFTCKWQSVSLRTLCFSNVFEDGSRLPFEQVRQFETFYNTQAFQELAISGKLDRWGENPSAYTYKQAARVFISQYHDWSEYVNTKMKIGSLYNVIRQRKYVADAIGYEDGMLFATTL